VSDEAARLCARLLREGVVPRAQLPDLDFPEVRRDVEERLAAVGLVLATSAYSDHVGIRLSPEVTGDTAFDAASNLGLRSDACALLVILWARLVLQKRTAADTREIPGQAELLTADRAGAARRFQPRVRLETLVREFRSVLGGRSHIQRLVSQLRRLRFLAGHADMIEPGPLLELGIDGERMVSFLRREVLTRLLEEREQAAAKEGDATDDAPEGLAAHVLEALARRGGTAAMGELSRDTGALAARLRPVLHHLAESGRIHRTGDRGAARYHLATPERRTEGT
jgi:hypothetical protein